MKLADRPTPETDRNTWDADLGNMVVYADIAKSLEQRLAHAVEALKFYARFKGVGEVAQEALAEIAASQEGRVG